MTEVRGQTLYDRLWSNHIVESNVGAPTLLYVDLHMMHEGTYLQAFETLRIRGLRVRHPKLNVATTDHFVPTERALRFGRIDDMSYVVKGLVDTANEFGVEVFGPNDERQGIVHVIGPELGFTLPGMTVVCADSHTSTHGAFGALAFGIGATQVGHVLASQCLLQTKQKNLRVNVSGTLAVGVTSKDLALYLLAEHGIDFGRGCVIEFMGPAISRLGMPERMSLCNMAIEMGSRSGLVAPDDTTFEYIAGRPRAPSGVLWEQAMVNWQLLRSDENASYEQEVNIDARLVQPMVSYGTTPGMAIAVNGRVPMLGAMAGTEEGRSYRRALEYMGVHPGEAIAGKKVRTVFIGSCTNSRIEDLRGAAKILRGRKVATGTTLRVVPGSQDVKRQAQAEGLVRVFKDAGAVWGEPGCSMCVAINGDVAEAGEYVASTSNRNFEGRQGVGARTLLMSPLTAAATAIEGAVADPRPYLDL